MFNWSFLPLNYLLKLRNSLYCVTTVNKRALLPSCPLEGTRVDIGV